ncbi:cryptochrome/photolyase family protein [Rhizobium sp. NPDC090275]|uniref:cryptochrome/photolyase family protein n=1 Tax=Rhizobium sp. NPDC090275 TaxID=3364498 RepID=UPI00383A943E
MAQAIYVGHHKKKIAFIFSAMRHFTDELRGAGYKVRHTKINDLDKAGSSSGEVKPLLRPGREWR